MVSPSQPRASLQQLGSVMALAIVLALAFWLGSSLVSPSREVVLVVVAALVAVCLLRPAIGLALVAVAVPFGETVPWVQVTIGPLDGGLGEILLGFVLLGWLARVAARRDRIISDPLVWPIAAFLGAEMLSAAFAPPLAESAKELMRWVEVIAIYLATISLVRKPGASRLVLGAIFAAGAGQALIGGYQFLTADGPRAFQIDRFLRAYGSFGQPNPYAGYLEMVVPLGLALVFVWRPARRDWLWWLALAAALLGCGAILLSLSRGAWLGMAVGITAAAAVATQRGRLVAAGIVPAAAFLWLVDRVGLLPAAISERVSQATLILSLFDARGVVPTAADFSVVERMAHWQAGWEMFLSHPLLGVGPGHYAIAYPQYAILPYWTAALGHAHNIYINVAAEDGVIGLIAYLVMVGSWLVFALRRARGLAVKEPTSLRTAVVIGVLGCLTAVAVHNIFDDLYVHMMNVQIGMLLGLASVAGPALGVAAREPSAPAS